MALIGYHASHEQFPPSELLACVQAAEQAGFDAAMCSDHFFPWSERQGQSGFAWAWLGAAMARTALPYGVVCAPGQRYHPAIIAQAAATLAEMFPDRFWVALGSGQLLNEHITGAAWPAKAERNARLEECVAVMRALWAGETVTHRGRVVVEDAKLYTLPVRPPAIVGAAVTPETAGWVARWADALITINQPDEQLRRVVDAFRAGGGAGKPMYLQAHVSWAPTQTEAQAMAEDQWRTNVFDNAVMTELRLPAHFDAATRVVDAAHVRQAVRVSSSLAQHAAWLHADLALGFDAIYVHQVGRNQRAWIEQFGAHVLPALR